MCEPEHRRKKRLIECRWQLVHMHQVNFFAASFHQMESPLNLENDLNNDFAETFLEHLKFLNSFNKLKSILKLKKSCRKIAFVKNLLAQF